MKRLLGQIIIIPILAIFYLSSLSFSSFVGLEPNFFLYGSSLIASFLISVIVSSPSLTEGKRKGISFFFFFLLFVFLGSYPAISIMNNVPMEIYIGQICEGLICLCISFLVFILYKPLFVDKKVLLLCFVSLLMSSLVCIKSHKINLYTVLLIFCILILCIFDKYNKPNHLFMVNFFLIFIVSLAIGGSVLSIKEVEAFNIRDNVLAVREYVIEKMFNGIFFNEDNVKTYLHPEGELFTDDIVLTIDTSYKVDRVKAYSVDSFEEDKNLFKLNNEKQEYSMFTKLFINENASSESGGHSMRITNLQDNDFVYVPYGALNFANDAVLYKDQLVLFKNETNASYELSFLTNSFSIDNYSYTDENGADLSTLYHVMAYNRYGYEMGGVSAYNISPNIVTAIENFVSRNRIFFNSLNYSNEKDTVEQIEQYLNNAFYISDSYPRNVSGLDDISHALMNDNNVNKQLLASIKMFVFRYFNIPSRLAVGYEIKDYVSDTAFVYANDKAYWPEVFVDGKWLPSDNLELEDENEGDQKSDNTEVGDQQNDEEEENQTDEEEENDDNTNKKDDDVYNEGNDEAEEAVNEDQQDSTDSNDTEQNNENNDQINETQSNEGEDASNGETTKENKAEEDEKLKNLITISFGALLLFILLFKRNRDKRRKIFEEYGIKTKEQFKLIKKINKIYLFLRRRNYVTDEINTIMNRTRFSLHPETKEDLKVLEKQQAVLKADMKTKKVPVVKVPKEPKQTKIKKTKNKNKSKSIVASTKPKKKR